MVTTITNGVLTASIRDNGAELISLKKADVEYIWEGNPEWWGKHAPVLFPIVGTLKNNRYMHRGTEYEMGRHGFARDKIFTLVGQTDASATFSLFNDNQTAQVYPFNFELRISYTIEGNTLSVQYEVLNLGSDLMYFSLGAHPAIALPKPFNQYAIQLSVDESPSFSLLQNDLIGDLQQLLPAPNGKFNLHYKLFENDALVFRSLKARSLTILENEEPYLEVTFDDFPDLGLWTKRGAKFICIEPWFGYADPVNASGRLSEKPGILSLMPSATFKSIFTLSIPENE